MARRTKKRLHRGTRINNKHNRTHQFNKLKVTRTGKRKVMTGGFKDPTQKETKPEETKPASPLERFQVVGKQVIEGLPPVNRSPETKAIVLGALSRPRVGAVELAKQAFITAAARAAETHTSRILAAKQLTPEAVTMFDKSGSGSGSVSESGSVSNPIYGIDGAENTAATGNPEIKASNAGSQYTPMGEQRGGISNTSYQPNPNPKGNSNPVYMEVGGNPTYESANVKRNPNDKLPPVPNSNPIHVRNPIYESGSKPSVRSLSNPNYNTGESSESNGIYSTVPGIRFNTPYSNPITYAKSELKKLKAELKPMRNTLKGNNRDSRLGNIVSNKRIVGMNNKQIYKFMKDLVGQKPGLFRSKKLSSEDAKVIWDKIISLRTKSNPLQFVKGLNNESESNSGDISVAGEEEV